MEAFYYSDFQIEEGRVAEKTEEFAVVLSTNYAEVINNLNLDKLAIASTNKY